MFDYNDLLYDKMVNEYSTFLLKLKMMTPEDVIEHAYEKVSKHNILSVCEESNLSQGEARSLYLMKRPLDYLYQEWIKTDVSLSEQFRDSVDDSAKKAVRERKSTNKESR